MKILMVNKFLYPKGGSETYMFNLSDYLKGQNHEVQFFGMQDNNNIVNKHNHSMVNNLDFGKMSLGQLAYPVKVIYSSEARKKISHIIEEFKPDLVHINNFNYQITPSILFATRDYNIPVVQTIHDPNIICPYHRLYNFQEKRICEDCKGSKFYNCVKTKCIDNSYIKSLLGTVEAYFYKFLNVYDNIDLLICPSKFMADKIVEFGVSPSKVRVLHNFVEDNPVSSTSQKGNYVLYFGRISEEKGINTLIQAIRRLPQIKFVFAGTGPMVDELSGIDNIEYVGFKNGQELEQLISESLFTISPSVCYENCPMSVLESQGLGTPVIGANIGGIPELIEDGKDGLLFESGNPQDLTEKILYLYDNKEITKDFSMKCKEKVQRFSIDKYYQKLTKIYNEAIENRGKLWKH